VPYDCGFGLLVLVDSTPRCLGAYIPSLSNSSSTSDLIGTSFPCGFRSLDAFSSYPVSRGYPALRSHTTGTPVATKRSSSRTIRSFTSSTLTPQ